MNSEAFLGVIDAAPLVSIDIILKDNLGRVLLGVRNNRPAQGYWFVPGGRIRKNESLKSAMSRISKAELGFEIEWAETRLLGAYDHIYDDNFKGVPTINTHYVALGYEVRQKKEQSVCFDSQHAEVRWWYLSDLLASDDVHSNTKAYFVNAEG